jgi:uncharacterized SAM-binding protein YcdF (DUF218 family)
MGVSKTQRARDAIVGLAGLLVAVAVLGFILFATAATRDVPPNPQRADGIVVLTGGAQRIEEGARLLEDGSSRRMLISGVNRALSREDVHKLTGLGHDLFACCVDVGYLALDTTGNAEEAKAWSRHHGFTSLIVVTASYHMPRSLIELSRVLPDTRLIPYPVLPKKWRQAPWYLDPLAARLLAAEYLKFVPAYLRASVRRASA